MNEQKDQRNHEPDDRDGEDEAGEDLLHGLESTINQGSGVRGQWSVISGQWSVVNDQWSVVRDRGSGVRDQKAGTLPVRFSIQRVYYRKSVAGGRCGRD